MKTKILQLLIFFIGLSIKAQNTQVIYVDANKTYKKHTTNSKDLIKLRTIQQINKTESIKKNIAFELIYNDKESVFKRVDMLIPKGEELNYMLAFISVPSDAYFYKNDKQKYLLKEGEGEVFKITYPNNQYDWKITKETKMILGHKCHKAITIYKEYDYGRDIEFERSYTAWFTYDIPLSYGPFGVTGLPGVVLEAEQKGTGFSDLHLKAKEINALKKFPKIPKGKEINYIEYNKLQGKIYKGIKKRQAKRKF